MDTIKNLKDIGATIYISTAGGGAAAITDLCSPPGRSSVILGATFINDTNLFNKYIGVETWSKYASQESARALSIVSQGVGKNGLKHIGIGIASSLATNNERVGRVNVTNIVATGYNFEIGYTHTFENETFENEKPDVMEKRTYQEVRISDFLDIIIECVAEIILNGFSKVETIINEYEGFKGFYIKKINQATIESDSINVYPGSFNPIHEGHLTLKKLSEEITGNKTLLEISLVNFEKKRIDLNELSERVKEIGDSVLVSYDKTFVEKYNGLIQRYPNLKQINFVCGMDTWERISWADRCFLQLTKKVKFIVFARNGQWISQDDLYRHDEMLELDERVKSYNNDISSSKIRLAKSLEKNK